MKYDDASWHYGGDFPADLEPSAGATHIGMFLAWCLLHGMEGSIHVEDFPVELAEIQRREITPGAFLIKVCDEKFTDEDLSEEGNAFAKFYYSGTDGPYGQYLTDYEETFLGSRASLYEVEDTWKTFDRIAPLIDRRYRDWMTSRH